MQRIIIIGTTGSGKSYLAQQLGHKLHLPLQDLDELYWLPDWIPAQEKEFIQAVEKTVTAPAWIVTGNYRVAQPLIWSRGDTLIWLDYGFWRIFGQLLSRTWHRIRDQKPLCNGNYESWRHVLSRKSIFLWFLKTYHRRRREYGAFLANPAAYPQLRLIRLRSRQETDLFLRNNIAWPENPA